MTLMPANGVEAKLRLFIAITLPEEIKSALEDAQEEIRQSVRALNLRWAGREQFHLTLKFLGNVPGSSVAPLCEAVRIVCGGFPSLNLKAETVGFFPPTSTPRVVWAGVQETEAFLDRLHRELETAVAEFTSEQPENRFKPHVTLARARDLRPREAEALKRACAAMRQHHFGKWTAQELEIIRSELAPSGARYARVAALPLAARA